METRIDNDASGTQGLRSSVARAHRLYPGVPGIELDFELTPHWHVTPYAQAGRAWDRQGRSDTSVYSLGADAEARKTFDSFAVRLRFGASYAAVEPDAELRSDDMVMLEAGIEGRRPLELELAGHPLDWGAYLFANYFVDRPDEPLDKATDSANSLQFEAGLTLGPQSGFTVWRIPVPRLGIGYRFGENLGVWRLVFGQPF